MRRCSPSMEIFVSQEAFKPTLWNPPLEITIRSTILTEYVGPCHSAQRHLMDMLQSNPRQHRWPSHPSADRHASEQYRDRSGTNHEQLQQVAVLQSNSCQHLQHHVIHSYTRKHFQQQHQLQRQRCRPRPGMNREELQQVGLLQSNLCHYFQHQHLH